jgi:hypothetical protein
MQDLAEIIDQLSARVDALESENQRLRGHNEQREGEAVSRRKALRLGGLAAGAAGAAVLFRPGTAHAGSVGPLQMGVNNDETTATTGLTSTNNTDTLHLGNTGSGTALNVTTTNGNGIVVLPGNGFGVAARASQGGAGLSGAAGKGTGPAIEAVVFEFDAATECMTSVQLGRGKGIASTIANPNNTNEAVFGTTTGKGHAVTGEINNAGGVGSAVFGTTNGAGAAVQGRSAKGVGAKFEGKVAQIQLVPSTATTHPATGSSGQLFVDSFHRLWYCVAGNHWKQLV